MVLTLTLAGIRQASAAQTVLYTVENMATSGELTSSEITSFNTSGFRTLVLFAMSVDSNGNFSYSGQQICANGSYVGPSTWGSQLSQCMGGIGGMNRIEMCIGGAGDQSFTNIKNLIASQGTGSSTNLYKNLVALQSALPISAINYDDEVTYDSGSAVAFGNMVGSLGMHVTLCPYTNPSYWQAVATGCSSFCDYTYLQCYDGGAGNDPASWASSVGASVNGTSSMTVVPLYWDNDRSNSIYLGKMQTWGQEGCIGGGLYPTCYACNKTGVLGEFPDYSNLIQTGTDCPYFMIINKHSGMALDLSNGNTSDGTILQQWTTDTTTGNQRWAVLPTENANHFKLISWVSGKCESVAGDSTSPHALINEWEYVGGDAGQQFDLVDAGNGWFNIRNVNSGLMLDVINASTSNGAQIQQYTADGNDAQLWRLQPWGNYFVEANVSDRYVCVQGAENANGSPIIQYDWQNNSWFKWDFVNTSNGWYAAEPLNATGSAISIDGDSTTVGTDTQLWTYSNDTAQQFRIEPQTSGLFSFFFDSDGLCWDIQNGGTADGTPLDQYTDNSTASQLFALQRAP